MIDVRTHESAALNPPTRPRASRRGVAMLLVIVAMGSATILTTSYLVSRSNSPGIGENATGAATAHWAARASADIAEAILETEADWRSEASDGILIDNAALGGADVTVYVTDLEGNPPDGDDRDVLVSVEAIAGGVRAIEERLVNVRPDVPVEEAIDPQLNEYAAFAGNEIRFEADALVGVWPRSPAARSGRPAKLGSGFTDFSRFNMDPGALLHNVAFFPDADAGQLLTGVTDEQRFADGAQVPLDVPIRPAALPDGIATLPQANFNGDEVDEDLTLDPADISPGTPLSEGRYRNLTIEQGAVVTLGEAGQRRAYSVGDMTIRDASALRVVGDVAIHVRGNLNIQNGSTIEIDEASTGRAVIFAANDVQVQDSGLGVEAAVAQNTARTWEDVTVYRAPSRLKVVTIREADGGNSSSSVQIKNQSIAHASLHVPTAQVELNDNSALIGRAAANRLRVHSGSALLYDPVLDRSVGFTATDGPLYNADGTPIDGLQETIDGLDPLATTADVSNALISVTGSLLGGGSGGGTTNISDRVDQRAEGRIWPIRALALESDPDGGFTDVHDGSFATIAGLDTDSSNGTSGGGTSGGGTSGGGSGSTDDSLIQTTGTLSGEED